METVSLADWYRTYEEAKEKAKAENKRQPDIVLQMPIGTTLEQAENSLLVATLSYYNGHKVKTATALGICPKTLYNKLRKLNLPL